MTREEYEATTRRYYARWLDCDQDRIGRGGLLALASPIREERQPHYPAAYPGYAMRFPGGGVILSHAERLTDQAARFAGTLSDGSPNDDQMISGLRRAFGGTLGHAVKFVFREPLGAPGEGVRRLTPDDYPIYEAFFARMHPNAQHTAEWLPEYFLEISRAGYCFARIERGCAISVTDAPGMPWMADEAQEIGIGTLPEHRGRGHARAACAAAAAAIIADGKCPMWSCAADNKGSYRLALSLGFEKFADLFTVEAV